MDTGILTIYKLQNTAVNGAKPKEQLIEVTSAYYSDKTIGITRHYTALSANQKIDKLVRCFNVTIPTEAEYVILEDGNQYRITFKQQYADNYDLTLERLGGKLDVLSN